MKTLVSAEQIKIIHIAKSQLHISDENYRQILAGFNVQSSKQLTYREAEKLILKLKELGFKDVKKPSLLRGKSKHRGWGQDKYEYLSGREPGFATPKQLRMLESMWRDVSRSKTDESFNSFIKRMTGIDSIEWIGQKHVTILISALQGMKQKTLTPKKEVEHG